MTGDALPDKSNTTRGQACQLRDYIHETRPPGQTPQRACFEEQLLLGCAAEKGRGIQVYGFELRGMTLPESGP